MSRDQSPVAAKADQAVQQYQANSVFQAELPPRAVACEETPIDDIDAVSLAMRQFFQSPTNAAG